MRCALNEYSRFACRCSSVKIVQQPAATCASSAASIFSMMRLTSTHTIADGFRFLAVRRQASPRHPCGSTPGRNHVPVVLVAGARRKRRHHVRDNPRGRSCGWQTRDRRSSRASEFARDRRRTLRCSRACRRGTDSYRRASRRGCVRGRRRREDRIRCESFSRAKPSRIASGVSDEIQSRWTGLSQPAAS